MCNITVKNNTHDLLIDDDREKVHRLEEVLVAGPLKLMKLSQSRANLVKLFNKVSCSQTCETLNPVQISANKVVKKNSYRLVKVSQSLGL